MAKTVSQMSIDELDAEIGERGTKIAKLREEQRKFLDAKDAKVLERMEEIRASGPTQTLGSN